MKAIVNIKKEIEIAAIRVTLPVRFGKEDMPYDFPLRVGDVWAAQIEIDTGRIWNWPKDKSGELFLKVCDEGVYELLDPHGAVVACRDRNYVPHGVVPGEYGDYVEFMINESGVITNWPKQPDVSEFFERR